MIELPDGALKVESLRYVIEWNLEMQQDTAIPWALN